MNDIAHANNCPIRERTADGVSAGRCWMWLTDRKCPRHGDVSTEVEHYFKAVEHYLRTGHLSNGKAFAERPQNTEAQQDGGVATQKEPESK